MTSTPVSDATLFFSNISTKNQNVTDLGSAEVSFTEVMSKTSNQNVSVFSGKNQVADTSKDVNGVNEKGNDLETENKIQEEPAKETEQIEESTDTEETKALEENTETVEEELEQKAEELVEEIARELGVTVEDVEKVLEELGISMAGLFDKENLTQVIVVLSGAEDVTQIVMDEELFAQVNNLLGKMEEMLSEVSENCDVTVEELMEYVKTEEFNSEFKMENSEVEVLEAENVENETELKETIKVEVETTEETSETKTDNTVKVTEFETSESTSGHTERDMSHSQAETNHQFLTNVASDNNLQNVALSVENGLNQYFTYEAREIMQQILDYIKVSVKPDMTSLQMQLNPEELGTLQIEVSNKNGMLTAQFTTQDESVKAIIEGQLIQLKENLNEQGLKVQAVEVTVASQQFDRNLDKNGNEGTTQQENPNAPKKQIRRINLNELDMEEDLVGADDAIRIAADMMARNGNTIDFMA
ncbi:MAG: flagellar hook-length control protein FliK [Agathobacter sp.]|nr:flagellar hook-length control protein FliK [Agathobacter sp.]